MYGKDAMETDLDFVKKFTKIFGDLSFEIKEFLAYCQHFSEISYDPNTQKALSIIMASALRQMEICTFGKKIAREIYEFGGEKAIDFAKFIAFKAGDFTYGVPISAHDLEFKCMFGDLNPQEISELLKK